MSHTLKYETTTEEGNKVRIEGPEIPSIPSVSEVVESLQSAHLPSNEEIDEQLGKAKQTLKEGAKEGHLDKQGKKLEKDLEGIIDSTSKWLNEKNKENRLQNMIQESKEGFQITAEQASQVGEEVKKQVESAKPQLENIQDDAKQLYAYIRDLSWNFIRSAEFRALMNDWAQYFQVLAAEKAEEVKEKVEEKVGEVKEKVEQQVGWTFGQPGTVITEGVQQLGDELKELKDQPAPPKEELEERTENKLNELLEKIKGTAEYQDFFKNLFKLSDMLNNYAQSWKEMNPVDIEHFQKAMEDARDFIAEFTGKEELEKFYQLSWKLYNDITEDAELRGWLWDLRSFMDSILERPDSLTEEQRKEQAKELTERGRMILQKEQWRNDVNNLKEQFQLLIENIRTDSTTNEWTSKLEKFGRDLLFNKKGMPDLFVLEDSIYQIKNIMVPLFKRTLENIPIKRIDIVTDTYDVRVEDILFDAIAFLPEHLDFRLLNASHMDFKDDRKDSSKHQVQLRVDHIRPEFKNLKFYYRRKSFPKIEDYGVADLALKGEGATINVVWTVESKGNSVPVAYLSNVECTIDKLNIHIVGEATKHDWLDTVMAPLVSNMIKKRIANTLDEYLKVKLNEANDKLNQWFSSRPSYQLKLKADQALKEQYQKNLLEQQSLQAK